LLFVRPSRPRAIALLLALPVALSACAGAASQTATGSAGAAASAPASADNSPPTGTTGEEPGSSAATETSSAQPSLSGTLTVYSGRSEELVQPVIDRFEDETGLEVEVNYASTTELAAAILEEGDASPADVFFSQDAGALGAIAAEDRLSELPAATLERVAPEFRSADGQWVGVSGRARVLAYDTRALTEADLPDSVLDLTDPEWKGKIGWAPSNASLQSFVTALRVLEGDDAARSWLEGIRANEPKVYEGNSQALEGVASGEVQVALINHYYLLGALAERGDLPVANHFFPGGDPGSLVNVAGVGILRTAKNADAAQAFVDFLLAEESQRYFSEVTYEYPLVEGVEADERLTPLAEIEVPNIDLSDLADLQGTVELMTEAGVL
jgi:iron(III) transport system substrate-binding protein